FIPYFDELPPATSDIKNVYVSAYRKTNHDVLLFIGNISLKTANATITIDFKRLGVNPKSVIDHVSGKELKLDNNNLKLEIEDEGYRMLRIEHSQVPEINIWG
ncbi:MAG: glycoside hydrolase domain-containing protein, partial [Lentisphaeria bacterium]